MFEPREWGCPTGCAKRSHVHADTSCGDGSAVSSRGDGSAFVVSRPFCRVVALLLCCVAFLNYSPCVALLRCCFCSAALLLCLSYNKNKDSASGSSLYQLGPYKCGGGGLVGGLGFKCGGGGLVGGLGFNVGGAGAGVSGGVEGASVGVGGGAMWLW